MTVVVERWPGGPWIAHRSQQGLNGKHLTLGPVQVNWYSGLRLYVTWPLPLLVYASRGSGLSVY